MSKREQRVVNAFINCVKSGEYSYDYAVTLMESEENYGYLTEEAKDVFYKAFETPAEEVPTDVVVEEATTEEETEEESEEPDNG